MASGGGGGSAAAAVARVAGVRRALADHLRSRGVYEELERVVRAYVSGAGGGARGGGGAAKKEESEATEALLASLGWPSSAVPLRDVPLLQRLQPGRLYLHARLRGGKAFAEEGAGVASLVLLAQFGAQRFASRPAAAARSPAWDESWVVDLGVAVRNPAGYAGEAALAEALQVREPLHLLVLREEADGEVEVVSCHALEWRQVLERGRVSLAVELRAQDPEVSAPAGVLDFDLELLPLRPPLARPAPRRSDEEKEKKKTKTRRRGRPRSEDGKGGTTGDESDGKSAESRSGSDASAPSGSDDGGDDDDDEDDELARLPVYVRPEVIKQQFQREASVDRAAEQRVRSVTRAFWRDYQQMRPSHVHRLIKLFATAEDGTRRMSCTFVAPLRAGRLIDSPLHAARFVSLVPWRKDCTIGGERTEVWHSLHTLLGRGRGDVEDHALLLCSLLLGFGLDARVCVGTGTQGAHVWVATRKTDDSVVFWEPLTGRRYDVAALLLQHVAGGGAGAPPDSVLPFRAVHCMFNDEELHANCQLDDAVPASAWRLEDPDAWKALRLADLGAAAPPRRALPRLAPCTFVPADEAAALERELRALVSFYRAEELKADTVFCDAFSYVLGPALAAYEGERVTGSDFGNEEFQQAVRRHLEPSETFRGLPFQFNHRNARRMLTRMLKSHRGACVGLVRSRGDAVRFGLRVKIVPYAEDVCAVWVMLAVKGRLQA